MRRRTVIIGVLAATTAVAAGAVVVSRQHSPAVAHASDSTTPKPNLATVAKRDLGRSEDLDGTIGHGEAWSLRLTGQGVLTGLPAIGDVINFGQRLAEVDGEPVVLLPGERPVWRSLGPGVGKGEDVRQLEAALVSLGYADPAKVVVDDTWTTATTAAVKSLQKLLGMPDDGRLDTGEVVFSPEVVRIAEVGGTLGDDAGAAAIKATALEQSVSMSLKASKADLVTEGMAVTVELPSGDTVDGTVADIGSAVVGGDGNVTFPVTVSTPPIDLSDGVSVTVTVDVVSVADATAVPAEALLALAEGGYGVEVPDETAVDGRRLVAVEVGEFADGWVQVTGGVKPGDKVVVP